VNVSHPVLVRASFVHYINNFPFSMVLPFPAA